MTEQLFQEYATTLCRYFKKRTGDRELCSDLTQDTFHKVLANRDKLEEIRNHKGWLFSIARNTLIDYTRKKREARLNDGAIPAGDEGEDPFEQRSDLDVVKECLLELIEEYDDGKHPELLLDIFTDALSQKEAAEYLDLPYSTLKSRVQKARKEILREYEERCCRLKYNRSGEIIGCGG